MRELLLLFLRFFPAVSAASFQAQAASAFVALLAETAVRAVVPLETAVFLRNEHQPRYSSHVDKRHDYPPFLSDMRFAGMFLFKKMISKSVRSFSSGINGCISANLRSAVRIERISPK
jgi:hypothetical protein